MEGRRRDQCDEPRDEIEGIQHQPGLEFGRLADEAAAAEELLHEQFGISATAGL